jgi:YggT family protein
VGGLISAIQITANVLSLVVLAQVVVSYFLNPFHPIRRILDTIVDPMLAPIRRVLPQLGGLDFSPAVLIILIQVIGTILIRIILAVT